MQADTGVEVRETMLGPFVGRPEHLQKVLEALRIVRGRHVRIDCKWLLSSSPTFPGRLVEAIVVDGGAAVLDVVNAPQDFADAVQAAAVGLGVTARVATSVDSPVHRITGESAFHPQFFPGLETTPRRRWGLLRRSGRRAC